MLNGYLDSFRGKIEGPCDVSHSDTAFDGTDYLSLLIDGQLMNYRPIITDFA